MIDIMDFQSMEDSELLKQYTKCGYIYKSPAIADKHHLLLTCLHCNEVFRQLECFLEHSVNHIALEDLYADTIEEGSLDLEASTLKTETGIQSQSESLLNGTLLQKQDDNNRKDPLEEVDNELMDRLADTIKTENIGDVEMLASIDGDFAREEIDHHIEDNNDDDVNFEHDRVSDEDTLNDENESDADCDNGNVDNTTYDSLIENYLNDDTQDSWKQNLKLFMKNKSFIRWFIQVYKRQEPLWDTTITSGNFPKNTKSLKNIASEINKKFNINVSTHLVSKIIKGLLKRFIHQYGVNLRWSYYGSGQCNNPVWFYDQLKFIEPHVKCKEQKTKICDQLTDEALLILIKLLKENECFWNEDNIYHTSVTYKQESLEKCVISCATTCNKYNFTVDDLRNIIEELKYIVVNENKLRLECVEANTTDVYVPQHRLYKDLQFLSPHVGPFRCSICGHTFVDIYSYKFHVSKHEGTKAFKCMVCHKELAKKNGFVCHLRRHTNECPYKCDLCDMSFPSQKERQRHVVKHGSKPYVCELCANNFYTRHQLTNHMKSHANIRDHVCAQCGKGFTHRGLLRQHLQTHNKTECVCSICKNVYANPRSLRKHYVRVHESKQEPSASNHNCKICMITFLTEQEAKQHRKEHKHSLAVKRKHVCDICGHDFAYPRNLADHKKTHSNVRDQVCDVCGKAFTNANLLNQHKNVHNGRKFVCKVCGKDYAHYRGLCRHMGKAHKSCVKDLSSVEDKEQRGVSPQQTL